MSANKAQKATNSLFAQSVVATLMIKQIKCSCAKPDANGWHIADDAGITFGTLKQAQNEAAQEIAEYIAHIYFTKSNEVFNDLMDLIADGNYPVSFAAVCEWEMGVKRG